MVDGMTEIVPGPETTPTTSADHWQAVWSGADVEAVSWFQERADL
jgi:hypothetical protein